MATCVGFVLPLKGGSRQNFQGMYHLPLLTGISSRQGVYWSKKGIIREEPGQLKTLLRMIGGTMDELFYRDEEINQLNKKLAEGEKEINKYREILSAILKLITPDIGRGYESQLQAMQAMQVPKQISI